jgi:lactoylglutathione lyase
MITELFPILSTPDMERSLAFYRDLLGGMITYEFPAPDGTRAYVGMRLGPAHLGIGVDTTGERRAGAARVSLWVYVDDCDALVERLRAEGVRVTEEPAEQPWGERVARVLDPDGNEVIVGQKLTR